MAFIKFYVKDNVSAQLDGGINGVQTSITIKNGQNLPADGATNSVWTITKFNTNGSINKQEKVLVTNKSGNTLTITRGYDGTTATNFDNDDYIFINVTAKVVQDLQDEVTRLETDKLNLSSNPNFFKYQIVTSVSSGNLTVALKNYLGTDPSATTPVKIQIGDTIRTITSALSDTFPAGTNWRNAGSPELATKEIDFFCYLGYSTSENKVNMGFSRIPYGILISDFNNVSDTGEKSFARSGVFNLIDKVVNIGRFNAILSAGPGYTWSTPATSVIINRPIYETRLLDIAPVFVSSSGTVGSVTNSNLKYKINGNRVSLTYALRLNKGTLTGGDVGIKVPFVQLIETPASGFICDITSTTPYTQLGLLVGGNGFIFGLKQSYTAGLPRTDISSDVNISTHGDYFI